MKNLTQEERRLLLEKDRLLDRHIKDTLNTLKKKYKTLSSRIIKAVTDLLRDLYGEEKPLSNYLNYKRYYLMLADIERECRALAKIEEQLMEEELVELYFIFYALGPIEGSASRDKAEMAVNTVWVSDGKHWQERVWEHEGKLYNRIDTILTNGVVSGIPTEVTENELKKVFDQAYNEDKALVDTEYSHIMNKANEDKYAENNIQNFLYVCVHDERTCTACLERDGKIFRVGDPVNTPTIHPNCRCTSLPIKTN